MDIYSCKYTYFRIDNKKIAVFSEKNTTFVGTQPLK